MIGTIDLTYSRYQHGAEPSIRERPETEIKPGRVKGPTWGAETPDGEKEMVEITDRLNRKAAAVGGELFFRMERTNRQGAHILMLQGETVLGRYGSRDIIDLERSLFDMAGFRFSIEG